MPNVKLRPCSHGLPVEMKKLDSGHWIITNDCCESAIDWNWSRLARSWNIDNFAKEPASGAPEGNK